MAKSLDPRHLFQIEQSVAERVRVRNIMNPTLWLCGISTPVFLLAAHIFREDHPLRNLLVGVSIVPLALAVLIYLYWTRREPDRLQSEEYQLQRQEMQLLQQKTGVAVIDPSTVPVIANPRKPTLPPVRGNNP